MKVIIHNWGFVPSEQIDALGFVRPDKDENALHHGSYEMTEDEMFEAAKKIYVSGLNVKFVRGANCHFVYVDNSRFERR